MTVTFDPMSKVQVGQRPADLPPRSRYCPDPRVAKRLIALPVGRSLHRPLSGEAIDVGRRALIPCAQFPAISPRQVGK